MLVLSRKLGEKIYIGDDICVEVLGTDRGQVVLGVSAPRSVRILRAELKSLRPIAPTPKPVPLT